MLRDFRKASKPEEQFIEDIRDGTIQVKMIKPVPGLGHYPWGLRRANFPQQKEMPEVEMLAKAETPLQPGMVHEWRGNHYNHSSIVKPGQF